MSIFLLGMKKLYVNFILGGIILKIKIIRQLIIITLLFSLVLSATTSASPLDNVATKLHDADIVTNSPIAENIEFNTYKNIAYTGELSAHDPNGEKITYQLIDKPARGSVVFSVDGSSEFLYTPYENKTGKDSFTYIALNESGKMSEEATVKINIQKPHTKVSYADLEGHPVYNAAIRLAEEEIFVGSYMDGKYYFQPHLPVSRSEFLILSMSAVGLDALDGVVSTGFHDDHAIATWAKPYVSSALKSGIVQGNITSNGEIHFGSNENISVADASFILNNLLKITDVPIEASEINIDSVPVWACQAVVNLESVGILDIGENGNMLPDHKLTRADTAEMLFAALNVLNARQ